MEVTVRQVAEHVHRTYRYEFSVESSHGLDIIAVMTTADASALLDALRSGGHDVDAQVTGLHEGFACPPRRAFFGWTRTEIEENLDGQETDQAFLAQFLTLPGGVDYRD